jgi:anti-sigma factor RsiW
MMDCKEARRTLWPADILRVGDAEVEAALEHAEDCDGCSSFLDRDRQIAQLIRESVPRARAPRALRERLYTTLARERAGTIGEVGRLPWLRRPVSVAALVLAGLALGLAGHWLAEGNASAPSATAFAEDYLRRVIEQEELRTSDRQQIASFFARELGVSMPPPEVPEYELQRATICLMNGRRGGVVEYRNRGQRISYYLIPRHEGATEERSEIDASIIDGSLGPTDLASESGLGVATWWDGDHQHALVGNLSAAELKKLAPFFACPGSRLWGR